MDADDIEKRLARIDDFVTRTFEEEPHSTATMRRSGGALEVEIHSWASPHRTILLVTGDGITIRDDFGPFSWTRRVPRESIERVTAETFAFANWDPYLAIHTNRKTLRVGWGVEEQTAHDVAVAIREVLQLP